MILYTRIENYRSIGKQQVLSAIPGSDKTHIDKLINIGVEKIIPVIPIYGGNATGKTNSLRFLKTLQDIIKGKKSIEEAYEPCKFYKKAPSKFEIIFIKNEIKYYYCIKYNAKEISEEKLYYYPNGRIAKIFDRVKKELSFGVDFEKTFRKYSEECPKDMSFLRFISNWLKGNNKNIDSVISFISNDLIFLGFEDKETSLKESINMFEGAKNRDKVQNFIEFFYKHLNIGAKGIKISFQKMDEDLINHLMKNKEFQNSLMQLSGDKKTKEISMPANKEIMSKFLFSGESKLELIYELNGKEITIDIKEESKGIQKIFELGIFIAEALCSNKVIIFDELELSFHPIISRKIVSLFFNKNCKSQLIFTTHDTNLLDLDLFRRDQIYFTSRTEKTSFQTQLKSLSEIPNVRKTTDIEKAYLKGEYCDIPFENNFPENELFGGLGCQI